ncbi:hypothetical protein RHMOL_Rhmol12G0045000 [Rhododendron molle]|uniref:Uncharacterized protein n=1 Tax=Rhododendron molle TaxID=49168 RepID=A0ACC0LFH2_RHOML|nr:hypothetical protein RHMOL_Rhmol12G0045000 [Rhododendron molle]
MAASPDSLSLDASFEGSNEYPNFILVGKIISSRSPNRQGVFNIINRAWRTRGNFSISVWKNSLYAFTFDLEEDLIKIRDQAPWSVMGGLLVLTRWDHEKSVEELDFSSSPFWVQVHGLPLGQMNKKNGSLIASMIGQEVVQGNTSSSSVKFWGYLRLRVIIDITKPLKKGFFLKREGKEDLWIKFKYERAPSPPSSSSEDIIVAADPLDKVARDPPWNVDLEGTTGVWTSSSLGESTIVVHGKPTIDTEEPIRATCPPTRYKDKRGNDSIPPLAAFQIFPITPSTGGPTTPLISGLNLAQDGPTGPIAKPDYYVEEPPDSPVRGEPLIPSTHTIYNSPSQLPNLPPLATSEPPCNPPPVPHISALKSSISQPKTLIVVPIDEVDIPTVDSETILRDSTGCERTRRVINRRATGNLSKGKKLCDVQVWFKSPISGRFVLNNINSALSWSIVAKEEMEKGSWSSDFLAKAIFIAWNIWIARNEMVFQGKFVSPQGVMARALGAWGEFMAAREAVKIHVPPSDRPPPAPKLWAAPPPGTLKINCDASWSDSGQKGSGGGGGLSSETLEDVYLMVGDCASLLIRLSK